MTSRAGRKIHPRAPWVAHPEAYSAPQQAQQPPVDDWDAPRVRTMSFPPRKPTPRIQAHLANMQGVTLGDPPRVPASTTTISVFIDGTRVRLPADWSIAFSSSKGKDTIYVVDSAKRLHVLTLNADGELRELHGLSADLVSDIVAWRFPRGAR